MCDAAKESKRIDAILAWAMNQPPVRHCVDEAELAGYGLAVLRCCYSDACPDECLRQRCAEYAIFIANLRRSQNEPTSIKRADIAAFAKGTMHHVHGF